MYKLFLISKILLIFLIYNKTKVWNKFYTIFRKGAKIQEKCYIEVQFLFMQYIMRYKRLKQLFIYCACSKYIKILSTEFRSHLVDNLTLLFHCPLFLNLVFLQCKFLMRLPKLLGILQFHWRIISN